jgi:hypothetical protein
MIAVVDVAAANCWYRQAALNMSNGVDMQLNSVRSVAA